MKIMTCRWRTIVFTAILMTTAMAPVGAAAQPQFIAGLLLPLITSSPVWLLGPAAVSAVAMGLGYALAGGIGLLAQSLIQSAFAPDKPATPKPEDGKFNLKQSVPPLTYVLGKVKKGGDYALLAEVGGTAYHVICMAGHRINRYVSFWLHDEIVAGRDSQGYITGPLHFQGQVRIHDRIGADAETAFAPVVSALSPAWTADHRGDGLASVMMAVNTVIAEDYQGAFPNQMPQLTTEMEGALLYDPRAETTSYSENLALMRLWHLTHPVGGKLSLGDMYLPDWITAADVCDEIVLNADGGEEPRYHGGFWFRANNNPVEVGRIMDQAAELILYERPDGKVGVHAGEFVVPDIRLTEDDIFACSVDANRRRRSTVIAVRGRYSSPEQGYNTVDAAIYGSPYDTEDERTKTFENVSVQRHNHCARLQKIAYTRSNAPRVTIVADYRVAKNVRFRRFVRVHYPPKLNEAVIELIGKPKLSLKTLQVEFGGIVVPPSIYSFNAATEEGAHGAPVLPIDSGGVPAPLNFAAVVGEDVVAGGTAAYVTASWLHVSDALVYEFEWQPTAGGNAESALSKSGSGTVDSAYLADDVEYRTRLRAWAVGTASDWTDYVIVTAAADATAPDDVMDVSAVGWGGQVTINWTAHGGNYVGARVLVSQTNDVSSAIQDGAPEYGIAIGADSRIVLGLAAGTWYGWVIPINAAGTPGGASATGSFVVT